MFYFVTITLMLHLPLIFGGIDVKIDGLIDLGPNWSYKYQIQPFAEDFDTLSKSDSYADPLQFRGKRRKRKRKNEQEDPEVAPSNFTNLKELIVNAAALRNHATSKVQDADDLNDTIQFLINNNDYVNNYRNNKRYANDVTKFVKDFTQKELYGRERRVKNDDLIRGFIEQVYKQNLRVFDTIKYKATDRNLRKKIDALCDNYKEKFIEFTNATQKQKIKTKLGAQKVVLNVIETSNRILMRLVNSLSGKYNKEGALREGISTAHIFKKEVEKETESEFQQACKKFGICRSSDGFSRFLVDVTTKILLNKDHKIKQACDALTEVLKNTEIYSGMDSKTEKRYRRFIDYLERIPANLVKPGLLILRNTIAHKDKPIAVNGRMDDRVNKTIAFLTLIDALEAKLPGNEANKLEWSDINKSLDQWHEGRRHDIEDIMQTFVAHIKKGFDAMQAVSAENANYNMQVILK